MDYLWTSENIENDDGIAKYAANRSTANRENRRRHADGYGKQKSVLTMKFPTKFPTVIGLFLLLYYFPQQVFYAKNRKGKGYPDEYKDKKQEKKQ